MLGTNTKFLCNYKFKILNKNYSQQEVQSPPMNINSI